MFAVWTISDQCWLGLKSLDIMIQDFFSHLLQIVVGHALNIEWDRCYYRCIAFYIHQRLIQFAIRWPNKLVNLDLTASFFLLCVIRINIIYNFRVIGKFLYFASESYVRFMSLTYIKHGNGWNTDPWGTPLFTLKELDETSVKTTLFLRRASQ